MSGSFEALNYALRKSKDGVIVSFVVQPSDVSPQLLGLAVGARLMIAWAEVTDKEIAAPEAPEAPKDHVVQRTECETPNLAVAGSTPAVVAKKDRRPFAELPLSAQAAMRTSDPEFQGWLNLDAERAKLRIYEVCSVTSRADLNTQLLAGKKWLAMERDFQAWRTDRQYAEVRR